MIDKKDSLRSYLSKAYASCKRHWTYYKNLIYTLELLKDARVRGRNSFTELRTEITFNPLDFTAEEVEAILVELLALKLEKYPTDTDDVHLLAALSKINKKIAVFINKLSI